MTNQEYLIAALNNDFDDGGASREAAIHYNICCPYRGADSRCECRGNEEISREVCVRCKEKWLGSEVEE